MGCSILSTDLPTFFVDRFPSVKNDLSYRPGSRKAGHEQRIQLGGMVPSRPIRIVRNRKPPRNSASLPIGTSTWMYGNGEAGWCGCSAAQLAQRSPVGKAGPDGYCRREADTVTDSGSCKKSVSDERWRPSYRGSLLERVYRRGMLRANGHRRCRCSRGKPAQGQRYFRAAVILWGLSRDWAALPSPLLGKGFALVRRASPLRWFN